MTRTSEVNRNKKQKIIDPAFPKKHEELDEIARYQQILSREPSSLVFASLAEAYRKKKLLKQAISTCKKGLRFHPNFVGGRVALAWAYLDSGQTEHARDELERVVLKVPDNLVAQRLLADIYKEKRDLDNLEKTVHRILSLDPQDNGARKLLAWKELQSPEKPVSNEIDHSNGEIVTKTLAEIYASQGYNEKAFEIYKKLSKQNPDNPLFHECLAEIKGKIVHRLTRVKAREGAKSSSAKH